MTGYGFVGPMTDMSTVFAPKTESAVVSIGATRYRYGYRLGWVNSLIVIFLG